MKEKLFVLVLAVFGVFMWTMLFCDQKIRPVFCLIWIAYFIFWAAKQVCDIKKIVDKL